MYIYTCKWFFYSFFSLLFSLIFFSFSSPLRAPTLDVLNVPNVKYLARLAHQTPKKHKISDVLNLIIFTTCYRIFTYLARYGNLWYMVLLFVYSSFSLSWSVPRFWVFKFVTSVAYGTNILTFVATIPSPHLWLQWHSPQILK